MKHSDASEFGSGALESGCMEINKGVSDISGCFESGCLEGAVV